MRSTLRKFNIFRSNYSFVSFRCILFAYSFVYSLLKSSSRFYVKSKNKGNKLGNHQKTTLSLTLMYVPPVVHAPRKRPIHITDDIRKELDEMVNLGVVK